MTSWCQEYVSVSRYQSTSVKNPEGRWCSPGRHHEAAGTGGLPLTLHHIPSLVSSNSISSCLAMPAGTVTRHTNRCLGDIFPRAAERLGNLVECCLAVVEEGAKSTVQAVRLEPVHSACDLVSDG